MQPNNRIPTHPGEVLLEEFLIPLRQTQVALAEHLGVPTQRINELVGGKRGVTPETAWLLAQALNATPEFWLDLQAAYDLAKSRPAGKLPRSKRASWSGCRHALERTGRRAVRMPELPAGGASVVT